MTKCNAVMAFIDRFLRGQLLFIINLSVYHSGLLLYPFPVSEGRKKSILEAVGHCSIVCSHAIFMITAILIIPRILIILKTNYKVACVYCM